jgi:hypothetical protein
MMQAVIRPVESGARVAMSPDRKPEVAETAGLVGNEYSHTGFKGTFKSPNKNSNSTGKTPPEGRS